MQLLQKEIQLYEKAKKEQQLEKEKLQEILATLVKAKLKQSEAVAVAFSRKQKDARNKKDRERRWKKNKEKMTAEKDAIEASNIHYFNDYFASSFPDIPKEKKNHTTVTVIPESEPEAIFKASVNNATMTLPLAPPEDDRTFCQVGGKLPVTDELYDGFTVTGHGICHIFKEENWDGCIGVGKYYPHDFTPEIAADFAGGPKRKIWMDMQRHMDG